MSSCSHYSIEPNQEPYLETTIKWNRSQWQDKTTMIHRSNSFHGSNTICLWQIVLLPWKEFCISSMDAFSRSSECSLKCILYKWSHTAYNCCLNKNQSESQGTFQHNSIIMIHRRAIMTKLIINESTSKIQARNEAINLSYRLKKRIVKINQSNYYIF